MTISIIAGFRKDVIMTMIYSIEDFLNNMRMREHKSFCHNVKNYFLFLMIILLVCFLLKVFSHFCPSLNSLRNCSLFRRSSLCSSITSHILPVLLYKDSTEIYILLRMKCLTAVSSFRFFELFD